MKPKEIDFGFKIPSEELWALEIAPEEMLVSDLAHNLDIAYLDQEGTDDWNMTPHELLANPKRELAHMAKVNNADMSHPIEIYFFDGSWKILDGVHRLCKAVREGHQTIQVRKVTQEHSRIGLGKGRKPCYSAPRIQ